MPEFGWAYVVGTMVQGVSGSVQTAENRRLSGSTKLVYNEASGTLNLTGALNVSGTINANELNINVINKNVINLDASGSTKFGDSTDDTHVFTGSAFFSSSTNPLQLRGLRATSASSSYHYLALDSNYNVILTASDGGPGEGGLITTYTNPGDNRVVTSIDANGINAEANMTFSENALNVTGDITSSLGVSSSVGQYTQLTASEFRSTLITDGVATFKTGSIGHLNTLDASSIHGALITPSQTNITSVGTLTGLNVAGDLSASTLYANDTSKKVGIGRQDPVRKLEVITTDPQLRLSYTDFSK